MLSLRIVPILALTALVAAPAAAQRLHKYVDANGKVVYTDKLPADAAGKATEQLNRQGTVVGRTQAAPTAEQRVQMEEERKRKLEETVRAKEEKRKNMALLNTYAREADIDDARARALKENEEAIKEALEKLDNAQKRQEQLTAETEFYKGKALPAQLKRDIRANEVELKAHADLLEAKRRETAAITARYDEDKRRYLELTKQPAAPTAAVAPKK